MVQRRSSSMKKGLKTGCSQICSCSEPPGHRWGTEDGHAGMGTAVLPKGLPMKA
jgi:hypothetical protein